MQQIYVNPDTLEVADEGELVLYDPLIIDPMTSDIIRQADGQITIVPNQTKIREKQLLLLRRQRNAFLSESDWTQLPDAPVDRNAWAQYRQALRDLPENTVDLNNPVWPSINN